MGDKAAKAMFSLTVAVEDKHLQHIRDAETLKEAWAVGYSSNIVHKDK